MNSKCSRNHHIEPPVFILLWRNRQWDNSDAQTCLPKGAPDLVHIYHSFFFSPPTILVRLYAAFSLTAVHLQRDNNNHSCCIPHPGYTWGTYTLVQKKSKTNNQNVTTDFYKVKFFINSLQLLKSSLPNTGIWFFCL